MRYILNTNIGANFRDADVGILPPLTAIQVEDKVANRLKDNISILVFDDIISEKEEVIANEEAKTYDDFKLECNGDIEEATKLYSEYQEELKNDSNSS